MSFDLKPYLDAVTAAQDAATIVAGRIDALVRIEGTEEERAQALTDAQALLPELDEAEANVQAADKLYRAMARVTNRNAAAHHFVPANGSDPDHQLEGEEPDEKVMNRAAFQALNDATKMQFIKGGGTVID